MNSRTLPSMLVVDAYLGIPVPEHTLADAGTEDQHIPMRLELELERLGI